MPYLAAIGAIFAKLGTPKSEASPAAGVEASSKKF